jgi:hypothetical protein
MFYRDLFHELEIEESMKTETVYHFLYISNLNLELLFRYKYVRNGLWANSNIHSRSDTAYTTSSLLLHLFINWDISNNFNSGDGVLVQKLKLHTIYYKWNILYRIARFYNICRNQYLRRLIIGSIDQFPVLFNTNCVYGHLIHICHFNDLRLHHSVLEVR